MKIVYSDPKSGRTAQAELSSDMAAMVLNKRIGEELDGAVIGLSGYTLKITGGSDKSGFPMENSIQGTAKRSVMKRIADSGKDKGEYRRKTVTGSTISDSIEQINTVITKYGDKPIDEVFPKKEKAQEEQKQ
ncbi:MAG: 30S ribosomal protein S6e [Candidatus Marsarchaeota archaeon]|nr:30S ribosomal protein S6e [Candidatus Marsarchaeota archaeon]MCL5101979.1 30S ribosomal protein S6e [Candidatus Marsarchaeota archaeon]